MTTPSPARPERLPRWELLALFLGDLVTLTIFAAVGRSSHSMAVSEGPLLDVLNTAAPFMLAWLLSGIAVGLYSGKALFPLGRVLLRTLVTGLIAGPLAVALRAIWLGRPINWIFVLVATGTSTLMMLVWRVAWSRLRRLWGPELP